MTTKQPLTTLSPAKLNLFLHITAKHDDGYHDLQTVFRLLDWGDEMQFKVSGDFYPPLAHPTGREITNEELIHPIRLHCDTHLTDDPMDNLIVKAAYALLEYLATLPQSFEQGRKSLTKKRLPIIDIYLNKKTPTGAGLGGGSSNSATTLMALNELWGLGLTSTELQRIGATLGADVPIFIYAKDTGSAIAEGIGEIFTPIELPPQQFLLLTPSAHISTAKLFAHPKLQRNIAKLSTSEIIEKQADFVNQLNAPFGNVFEPVVCELSEEVAEALAYLQMFEPITNTTARMTGSGSCVFLPLAKEIDIAISKKWLENAPCLAYIVGCKKTY